MRAIEHRRHSMRHKPGEHLNQTGVDLARRVGNNIGPFDLVITSTTPRAFETAIAMGFAVNEQLPSLETLPAGFEDEVDWDAGYMAFPDAMAKFPDGAVATYARSMRELHIKIAGRLQEGASALVISHGGVVEASAVGCLPDGDFEGWPGCDYCEGVRLTYDGGKFTGVELLGVGSS
ncbi:MAG: histidine phosphatase family protein [Actinobacteria bacterium]|nr:histidine phosphatase family protein [Actinomycetota bacterium]